MSACHRTVGKFHMVASAAAAVGPSAGGAGGRTVVGGCELWVHQRLGGSAQCCIVLVSSPLSLTVRFKTDVLAFLAVAAHAPIASSGEVAVAKWWAELDQVLRSVRKDGELCILLADTNARVGPSCSPFVGPEGAEEENPSGFELHQFLATPGHL